MGADMSENQIEPDSVPLKVSPESVRLRAEPQRVTRLNRRTLAVLAGGGTLLVMGALMWSLQPVKREQGETEELYNADRISRAEGLETLPHDYSQIRV